MTTAVDHIKALLGGGDIEEIEDRVDGAAELSALIKSGKFPTPAYFAWVVPAGLRPRGQGDAAAGAFTQMIDEHISVVLMLRSSGDATGERLLGTLDQLVWEIVDLVCGTDFDQAVGVFRLQRAAIISLSAGRLTYQIEFAIQQQIRIVS